MFESILLWKALQDKRHNICTSFPGEAASGSSVVVQRKTSAQCAKFSEHLSWELHPDSLRPKIGGPGAHLWERAQHVWVKPLLILPICWNATTVVVKKPGIVTSVCRLVMVCFSQMGDKTGADPVGGKQAKGQRE